MEIRITESRRQSKTKYRKQLSDILLETALIGLTAGAGLWLVLELLTESGQMMPLLGSVLLTALICSVTERMEKCGIYIRGAWQRRLQEACFFCTDRFWMDLHFTGIPWQIHLEAEPEFILPVLILQTLWRKIQPDWFFLFTWEWQQRSSDFSS